MRAKRDYFGQAARSLSPIDLYSSGVSFLLGAGVPGALPPNDGYDVKMRMVNGLAAAESVILTAL